MKVRKNKTSYYLVQREKLRRRDAAFSPSAKRLLQRERLSAYLLPLLAGILLVFILVVLVCALSGSSEIPSYSSGTIPMLEQNLSGESSSNDTDENTAAQDNTEPLTADDLDITLCFGGDISLSDDATTTAYWEQCGEDITQCIDEELIDLMRSSDLCFLNNEFPYSVRGEAMEGKNYTFRADPTRVSVLQDLGVDMVSLANNHAYDYGEDAFLDTLDTLEGAGITYVGAGRNIDEASAPVYVDFDGFTVAFLSGTRVEWEEQTKGATDTNPGVFRTVDPELLYERTQEASENADYVVVYMHWGIEAVDWLEDYQTEVGHGLIDAGADIVIGDHPHYLQGIEYYRDKPILYSMGNFWFNSKTMDTMLALVHLTGSPEDIDVTLQLVPAKQSGCRTLYYSDPDEQDAFYRRMESLSYGFDITIDENGVVSKQGD